MHTAGKVDALGKRLRENVYGEDDIRTLEEYRASFDELLLANSRWVGEKLAQTGIPAVVAGRSKRTKSTIRKLARPQNHGMDLSRMVDMAGIRVVVRDLAAQRQAVDALQSRFYPEKTLDYLDDGKPYRAVHLILKEDKGYKRLEIQIRTVPQQLWANESESFGEQVKEGAGPEDVRNYLRELSDVLRDIEVGEAGQSKQPKSNYFDGRSTLSFRLPVLVRHFEDSTRVPSSSLVNRTFVVVYDNEVNQCTQRLEYGDDERTSAVQDYQRITRSVDDSRFETLILNSPTDAALRVTHPRFFPEGA